MRHNIGPGSPLSPVVACANLRYLLYEIVGHVYFLRFVRVSVNCAVGKRTECNYRCLVSE
jgi:hypothetical protein